MEEHTCTYICNTFYALPVTAFQLPVWYHTNNGRALTGRLLYFAQEILRNLEGI